MNRSIALLTAVACLAAACSSADDDGVSEVPDSTLAVVDDGPSDEIAGVPDQLAPGDLGPGSYESGLLGTELSITTTRPWFASVAEETVVILEDPEHAAGSDAGALLLLRPTGFLSDGDIRTGYVGVTGSTSDIDAWIDLVRFDVEDRVAVEIDGWPAEVITGTAPAGGDTFLRTSAPLPFNGTPDGDYIYVKASSRYRIWLIDQVEFAPIVVVAIADLNDDGEWFAVADELLATLTLGDPAEHPNPPVSDPTGCIDGAADVSGEVLLRAAGGLRFTSEVAVDVMSDGRSPRTEIYEPGTFATGFFVLGPVDESPEFADAATARAHIIGDRSTLVEPVLEGFGGQSVGAVIDPDSSGSGSATVFLDDGADRASIPVGNAFWFFDTEIGVFAIVAFPDGAGDLEPSLAMVNSIVPTMELVDGLCG